MRQIGALPNEQQARKLQDHLLTLDVKSMVEESTEGWAVWIYDEDRVVKAKEELAAFAEAPDDLRYADVTATANALREEEIQKAKTARKNIVDVRQQWQQPLASRCPVTFTMISISVIVAAFSTSFERGFFDLCNKIEPLLSQLLITPVEDVGNGMIQYPKRYFDAVLHGQVWRLVTPIFVHNDLLHILFNMYMFRALGSAVELRRGRLRYLLIVLTVAVTSNVGQLIFTSSPLFGGMSGVVYGLFGYIWMKSRFDPSDGLYAPPNLVFILMAWLFLCMTPVIANVANAAHVVGLGVGMAMGYSSSQLRKMRGR